MNKNIITNKQKLDALFSQIAQLRTLNNLQIESQWATYLCIRLSGLLETSVKSIYLTYCGDKAHPNISRYIGHSFNRNRSQSMKSNNILKLVRSFSENWGIEFEDSVNHGFLTAVWADPESPFR